MTRCLAVVRQVFRQVFHDARLNRVICEWYRCVCFGMVAHDITADESLDGSKVYECTKPL